MEKYTFASDASPVASAPAAPVATASAVEPPRQAPSPEQVTQALKSINKTMEGLSQGLEFTIDEDSHRTIVKVVDRNTKDVIRQIPTEEALEIAKALDQVTGLLIRQKA
ncbi:hypothetical protein AYR66_19390 [Noviherbaspirillum denitrificans]|uniref:Flagellar biosynthesis protein FlaG n=1 Tax=Noviherbaspirillum denitrificans TaxID=1968433 RepID=A0A254TTA5_9BURK|nr:hypothetical protein AYR66_19390 [Noviherbaspirillum denitrificans]